MNSKLHHFYLPSSSDGTVTVLGVSRQGKLKQLGRWQAERGAHGATSDDSRRPWVCGPDAGSLLVFDDAFPPVSE
jgi:hypothetical protein